MRLNERTGVKELIERNHLNFKYLERNGKMKKFTSRCYHNKYTVEGASELNTSGGAQQNLKDSLFCKITNQTKTFKLNFLFLTNIFAVYFYLATLSN